MKAFLAGSVGIALLIWSGVASAQTTVLPFPGFAVVDECGGIPSFMGSSYMVETANGLCGTQSGLPITTIKIQSSSQIRFTLSAVAQTFGIATGDTVTVSSPACLAGLTLSVTSVSGNPFTTANAGSCTVGNTYTGGTLNVAFLNGTSTRYAMRLLTKGSTSWASLMGLAYLYPASLAPSATPAEYTGCSMGNPSGYTDGTHYYLAFLMQDNLGNTSGCMPTPSGPGQGQGYDLWVCNLTDMGVPNPAKFNSTYCNQIVTVNTSLNGAMLDPHIHNGTVYVSERNNSTVVSQTVTPSGNSYNIWSIDQVPVTWSATPPTVPSGSEYFVFDDTQWNSGGTSSLAHKGCEEYYKLTGFVDLPGGTVRAFFQANDVMLDIGGTVQNPYAAVPVNTQPYGSGNATCDAAGVGNGTDAFAFSGIFYGDLVTTGALGSGVYAGSNFTQIYPPVYPPVFPTGQAPVTIGYNRCVTPQKNITCYGEFPWVFKDGRRIMFEGSLFTPAGTVDACAGVSGSVYCQPNYADEWLQGEIFTDFSQSTYPMTIVALAPMTDYNVFGKMTGAQECATILWDQTNTPNYQNCGLYGLGGPTFGGCSRMDIDEATQNVACADQSNRLEMDTGGNSPLKRTLVVSYAGAAANGVPTAHPTAIFNQAVESLGGISTTVGISIQQQ